MTLLIWSHDRHVSHSYSICCCVGGMGSGSKGALFDREKGLDFGIDTAVYLPLLGKGRHKGYTGCYRTTDRHKKERLKLETSKVQLASWRL